MIKQCHEGIILTSKKQKGKVAGKVFGYVAGQGNEPKENKKWEKIGSGQRASQNKLKILQMIERNKQKG